MLKTAIAILTIIPALSACGGSDVEFEFAFVSDVRVDPDTANVGTVISIQVEFDPNHEEDDGVGSVQPTDVVVLLPPGVDYVEGSSEFDGSILDDFDDRSPDSIELCGDGSRALRYSFDDVELSTLGENRLRLKGRTFEARGTVSFIAEADVLIGTPCGITGTDSDQLLILP